MKYRVREIRKEKGMTQVELAKESKVARGIIIRLESDKEFGTSVNTLQKLANALNCEMSDIFCQNRTTNRTKEKVTDTMEK